MKFKNRALAILLSMVMVLTFMPALAFAGEEGDGADVPDAPEVTVEAEDAAEPEAVVEEEAEAEDLSVEEDNTAAKDLKGAGEEDEDYDDYDDYDYDPWIEFDDDANEIPVFSDGDKVVPFYAHYDGGDFDIAVKVGKYKEEYLDGSWDEWTQELLTEGTDYSYDASSDEIILHGKKIFEKVGAGKEIIVAAAFIDKEDGTCITWSHYVIRVAEARVEYELDFEWGYSDKVILFPEETNTLYQNFEGYVENATCPRGEYIDCKVTDAVSSDPSVFTVTKKSVKNNKGKILRYDWVLKGISEGEATLNVTFNGATKGMVQEIPVTITKDKLELYIEEVDGYYGIPGDTLTYKAGAWYNSYDYGWDNKDFTYDWRVDDEDTDYAEVKVDEADPSIAYLKFKEDVDLEEDRDVDLWLTVTYTTKSGKVMTATESIEACVCQYNEKLYPDDLDEENIYIGHPVTFTPYVEISEYDPVTHESKKEVKEDVKFTINSSNKKVLNVIKNKDGSYTLKRLKNSEADINISSSWEDTYTDDEETYTYEADGPERYFWFPAISKDLSKYHLELGDSPDDYSYYIDPSNEGVTPEIKVVDAYGNALPKSEYKLVVQKYSAKKSKYITSSFPLKFNVNASDPYNAGVGYYRIYAKPSGTKRYINTSARQYVEIYNKNTLVYGSGVVSLGSEFNQYRNSYSDYDWRYNLPADVQLSASDLEVYTSYRDEDNRITLTPSDYNVKYKNLFTGEESEEIPTAVGAYTLSVSGTGDFVGLNEETSFFIGEKNPVKITVATKTVKLAKVKKAKQIVSPVTVTDAEGEVTYEKWGGSARLLVNKTTGKVTVKKGTKKGTYHAWICVNVAGTETVAPERQVEYITVKVK